MPDVQAEQKSFKDRKSFIDQSRPDIAPLHPYPYIIYQRRLDGRKPHALVTSVFSANDAPAIFSATVTSSRSAATPAGRSAAVKFGLCGCWCTTEASCNSETLTQKKKSRRMISPHYLHDLPLAFHLALLHVLGKLCRLFVVMVVRERAHASYCHHPNHGFADLTIKHRQKT